MGAKINSMTWRSSAVFAYSRTSGTSGRSLARVNPNCASRWTLSSAIQLAVPPALERSPGPDLPLRFATFHRDVDVGRCLVADHDLELGVDELVEDRREQSCVRGK